MPYALHLVLAEQNDGAALGRGDVAERLIYALCLMPYALCLMPYSSTPRVGGAKMTEKPLDAATLLNARCPMPYALCLMPYSSTPRVGGAK